MTEQIKTDKTINEIYDEFEVSQLLMDLGVHPECKGYDYIITAMNLVKTDRTYLNDVVKRLYVDVAAIKHVTPMNIERCIRHETQRMVKEKTAAYEKVFGNTNIKLTNSRMLACVYEHFRIRKRIEIDANT